MVHAKYLVNTIPIISSSLELLFERFSKNTFITKSVVIPIWQSNNAVKSSVNSHQYTFTNNTAPITEPIVSNSTFDDLSCASGERLVDTSLSILKMLLLCFNILDLTGDYVTTNSIYHTKIFITFELTFITFILYYIKFFMNN